MTIVYRIQGELDYFPKGKQQNLKVSLEHQNEKQVFIYIYFLSENFHSAGIFTIIYFIFAYLHRFAVIR